jgi:hypothetical protein
MPMPPPDEIQYLDLADYLWLAGAALGRAPEAVFDVADLGLAESALHAPAATYGGVEFYPDLVTKARVLVIHLLIFADLGEGVGQDPAHGYQTLTSSQPRPRC